MKKVVASTLATGSLLVGSVAPVFAGTTIVINGNGSDSDNEVEIERSRTTTVVQENNASIDNDVDVDLDTGHNRAEDNTGGDVAIETGDTDSTVEVHNAANSNSADVSNCDCDQDVDVTIEGNGTGSKNEVEMGEDESGITNVTEVWQSNKAKINNDVDVEEDSGRNRANDNTNGDVEIITGDNDSDVFITNEANANVANIGGSGDGGELIARIADNGSHSKNEIELGLSYATILSQENKIRVNNDVDVDADSGHNKANDNTGGEVGILTGDTDSVVEVDNMVNFNAADMDCDCVLSDITAKVVGNGTDSENEIEASFDDTLDVFQENSCRSPHWRPGRPTDLFGFGGGHWPWGHHARACVENDVDVDGNTGDNRAGDNTLGSEGGDPVIETGDADSDVIVGTTGNVNSYGQTDFDLGDVDFNFNFSLNFEALLNLLGLI